MKGHVSKRGKTWAYWFDIDPDPLTGKRRQQTRSGFKSEKEAWKQCRTAIADYERGRPVSASRRKVAAAFEEWLIRIEHSIKPSMAQNWRNYAAYYVIPYIGQRDVQEIDGAVCDALYAKLLSEGRVKARPKQRSTTRAVHTRRLGPGGQALPCRPYSYDAVRCFRTHAEDDPAIGQPITPKKLGQRAAEEAAESARRRLNPGLEPKTVVNTHRMLHRAWEDFTTWGWAKRNVVSDAHPPRVPRKGRKVWTVTQLQTFLQRARSDRFFALWVLEATSGMRRCELAGARRNLLDLDAGTLTIEGTRVVVDGRVIESDGKDRERPACPGTRPVHPGRPQGARRAARPGAAGLRPGLPRLRRAVLLAGRQASPPRHHHAPVQEARRGGRAARDRPARRTTQLRHRGARCKDRLEGAQQAHRPCGRGLHHEAVRPDRPGSRPPGGQHPSRAHHWRLTRVYSGRSPR